MSWESVLKINDATKLLRTMLTISKQITSKDEMKLQAYMLSRMIRSGNIKPKLESVKNAIRASMDSTWRDPDMAEKLLRNDPSIIKE